jgi:GntR family transcriptional regulator of arabinose operon
MKLKYIQLADALREEILRREPSAGRRLPTESELMKQYALSRQTVRQALDLLQKEGLITKRQGSGSYIADRDTSASNIPGTIAVVTPYARNSAFLQILWDMQSLFSSAGFSSQVFSTENLVFREREILTELLEHPVSGILVQPTRNVFPSPNLDLYERLIESGCAIFFLGQPYTGLEHLPHLCTDDYLGGYLLTSHLIRQGHRRIAGIFQSDEKSGLQRFHGCLCALRDHSLPFDDHYFFWYQADTRETSSGSPEHSALLPFVQKYLPDCSAVICQSDEAALFLVQELERQNIRVPEQITVAGFGGSAPLQKSSAHLVIAVPAETRLWIQAAHGLLRLIRHQTFSSVPYSWVIRDISRRTINTDAYRSDPASGSPG